MYTLGDYEFFGHFDPQRTVMNLTKAFYLFSEVNNDPDEFYSVHSSRFYDTISPLHVRAYLDSSEHSRGHSYISIIFLFDYVALLHHHVGTHA